MQKQWLIITEEITFLGLPVELSDTIGMNLSITTHVRKLIRLSSLQEKKYSPNIK
ncbi:MAG TPA: hypothetical protein VMZ29_00800 [Candidatus Bathyarchaeia archaeon]|nr:hypothetical protein [Candidatus Bathyarchaeia archaeon]